MGGNGRGTQERGTKPAISQLMDLEFRPPAPTRRAPRRIAKRRMDKAARRDNGRPFRVAVASKLPIPVCVGTRPVQLLDERSSAIKLSKIPRRGARPVGRPGPRLQSLGSGPFHLAQIQKPGAQSVGTPGLCNDTRYAAAAPGQCAGRAAVPPAADVRP